MLFATYIIRGLWNYEDVPEMLIDDDKILIAEGREDLIVKN